MKPHKFYLVLSVLVFSSILFSACGAPQTVEMPADGECPPGYQLVYPPAGISWGAYCQLNDSSPPETLDLPADGECPPGYHPEYPPAGVSWGAYCQLNSTPETVDLPADGECPPGYHLMYALAGEGWGSYCQLNDSPPPETVDLPADGECPPGYHPEYPPAGISWGTYCQLNDSSPPETVDLPADGDCPPGYHPEYPPAGVSWGAYCQLNPKPAPRADNSSNLAIFLPTLTPIPPAQASNSGMPDLKPAIEVVQYCANKGANLGGANISYPHDSSLHIEDWFSQSLGDVKCADDISNPRTCWGPESATFEAMLCNTDMVQNQDYACETLPVTLGACAQKREQDNQSEPVPTPCGHC